MQPNSEPVRFGAISDGPDLVGRDRHRVLLIRIFRSLPPTDFGTLRPGFLLHFAGRYSEREIEDGVASVRIYRDGIAVVELNLSTKTILLPEEQFRDGLAALIRLGANRLASHAKKKKLTFPSEPFLETIEKGLKLYQSTDLPLPATNAEMELAEKWLGVPKRDSD